MWFDLLMCYKSKKAFITSCNNILGNDVVASIHISGCYCIRSWHRSIKHESYKKCVLLLLWKKYDMCPGNPLWPAVHIGFISPYYLFTATFPSTYSNTNGTSFPVTLLNYWFWEHIDEKCAEIIGRWY